MVSTTMLVTSSVIEETASHWSQKAYQSPPKIDT